MSRWTDADRDRARRCWRTLEPYHGFVYFAPEAAEEYAAIGLHGRSGYFVSRSAAMGRVTAGTVIATFYNFHPDLVRRAMADAGGYDPEVVLGARSHAVDRVIVDRLADAVDGADMRRAADLAVVVAEGIEQTAVGRPLAMAHADLPVPDAAHLRLWWAITALREFRGDGHLAALVAAELTGLEALILHAGSGEVGADVLRQTRSWSADEWAAGVAGLAARGLVDGSGELTAAGSALRAEVEHRTDDLAAGVWARLSDEDAAELRGLVRPWSRALFAGMSPG